MIHLHRSMLNPFPIQWLALFAFSLLRVCLGLTLLVLGRRHWRERQGLAKVFTLHFWPYGRFSATLLAIVKVGLGSLLILGAHTQYAALVVALLSLKLLLLRPWFSHPSLPSRLTYFLMFGMAVSLFITGAGALAVDLPL